MKTPFKLPVQFLPFFYISAHARLFVQWQGNDILYGGHIKDGRLLYITRESLAILGPGRDDLFDLSVSFIRYVKFTGTEVRIFWRNPKQLHKGRVELKWHIWSCNIDLDIKKMYDGRKERNAAKKTEGKKLATVIINTVQASHTGNTPIPNDCLLMYAGEHLVESYKGESKWGSGKFYISNLGVYFVDDDAGLVFIIPFNIFNGVDLQQDTLKIHYFEPIWIAGQNPSSSTPNVFDVRLRSDNSAKAYEILTTVFKATHEKPETPAESHPPDNPSNPPPAVEQTPLDVLKMKLVHNEISEEEYQRKKKLLTD